MSAIRITAVGAITSIGSSAVQTDASMRAGLCRFHAAPWPPADGMISLAAVNVDIVADALARLRAEQSRRRAPPALPLTLRLFAIAGLALADAIANAEPERPGRPAPARAPVVLMLALPDPREGVQLPAPAELWSALALVSGVAIDAARSQVFARGRAAIFDALAAARDLLAREPEARVVCGGADSYVDETRVRREHEQGRTLGGPYAGDGRPLGEAAGMLVVESPTRRRGGVLVTGIGRVDDPGHRFGSAPARGEGLANAIEALRTDAEPRVPFATVWAGLVGESFDGKQWGTACLRHRDRLLDDTSIEHPADRIGDAGAGLGAMLLVDAHQRLVAGRRAGPALLWAISDHGPIGTASVELDTPGASR